MKQKVGMMVRYATMGAIVNGRLDVKRQHKLQDTTLNAADLHT